MSGLRKQSSCFCCWTEEENWHKWVKSAASPAANYSWIPGATKWLDSHSDFDSLSLSLSLSLWLSLAAATLTSLMINTRSHTVKCRAPLAWPGKEEKLHLLPLRWDEEESPFLIRLAAASLDEDERRERERKEQPAQIALYFVKSAILWASRVKLISFIHSFNEKKRKKGWEKIYCQDTLQIHTTNWFIPLAHFNLYFLDLWLKKYTHMHRQLFHIFSLLHSSPVGEFTCFSLSLSLSFLQPKQLSLIAFKKMGVLFNHFNQLRSQRVSFLYLAVGGSAVNSSITHSHRVEMGEKERKKDERRTRVVNTKWFVESDWLYLWVNE